MAEILHALLTTCRGHRQGEAGVLLRQSEALLRFQVQSLRPCRLPDNWLQLLRHQLCKGTCWALRHDTAWYKGPTAPSLTVTCCRQVSDSHNIVPGICELAPRYEAAWLGIQLMKVVKAMPIMSAPCTRLAMSRAISPSPATPSHIGGLCKRMP